MIFILSFDFYMKFFFFFFFSSRRRHTRYIGDWSSDVCSSDLPDVVGSRLFEGFVTAAVTAIEQRDPTTSGHSFRVADLTVELAKTVDGIENGQIGRASCRERVWISVVAVSLKKKEQKQ